ncbi:hypothetical protein EMCRGX_G007126 [Ephydatia muelleri]
MAFYDARAEMEKLNARIMELTAENESYKACVFQHEKDFKMEREDRIRAVRKRTVMEEKLKAYKKPTEVQPKSPPKQVHTIHFLDGLDQRLEKGHGSFEAVYEVKLNGLPCIAKGLHEILLGLRGNCKIAETDKQAIRQKFLNECVLLSKLKHPNIVQFLGVHSTKENEYLVMEYMHMDLAECLETYHDIPPSIKFSILHDVLYGLLHLHSQDPPIIHRDLTAANILLTQDMRAKIADLGISKIFDIQQLHSASELTMAPGTKAYMPPEALIPHPKPELRPTTKELCRMIGSILPHHKKEWKNVLELCSQVRILESESDQYRKQLGVISRNEGRKAALEENERIKMENKSLNMRVAELRRQLDTCKQHLKTSSKQYASAKRGYNSLEKNASSTEEVLAIMMKKHHVHWLELEAAKEEIAVKVAQVKQYQKQVEAYKLQLEQPMTFIQVTKARNPTTSVSSRTVKMRCSEMLTV